MKGSTTNFDRFIKTIIDKTEFCLEDSVAEGRDRKYVLYAWGFSKNRRYYFETKWLNRLGVKYVYRFKPDNDEDVYVTNNLEDLKTEVLNHLSFNGFRLED